MLMMMRADESYSPSSIEGCTAEQVLSCLTADDFDACVSECSEPENPEEPTNPGYAKVTTKAASTQTVALNAVEKKIGTVTLTAGDNDTTVTNIEITKSGLGDEEDILSIRLMKDGEYVTKGNYSHTKRTATLRFTPKLTIKAGKSETFDVVVSLDGQNANGQHDFSVTAVTVANGSFGGTPAKLGSLVTTNYSVDNITTDLVAGSDVKAGDEAAELLTLELTSEKTEAKIESVTIDAEAFGDNETVGENADLTKVFKNVKAYINNEEVGNVVVNDESIVIKSLNQVAKKGKKTTITLKGDVIYVGKGENIAFTMGANYVNATETNTNERMSSDAFETEEVEQGTPANYLYVEGVDLELKNLTTKVQKYAPGTQDAILLDLELSAGSDLDITAYSVKTINGLASYFEDDTLKLYVDGVDYDLSATNATTSFNKENDWFTVDAGNKVSIQVKGDIRDLTDEIFGDDPELPIDLGTIEFSITRVKNLENNKTMTLAEDEIVKKAGHTSKIDAGTLKIKDTLKTSNNLLEAGATGDVLGFSVKASSEKLTLTGFTFTVAGALIEGEGEDEDVEVIKQIALYKKGSNSAIKTIQYDDNAWTKGEEVDTITISTNQSIKADETVEFRLEATLNNGSVKMLGQSLDFALTNIAGETESSVSITTPVEDIAENFQVSAAKPTFDISKNGNKITVVVTNESDYDIDLAGFILQVIGNVNDNGINPFENALGGGEWKVQNNKGANLNNATAGFSEDNNYAGVSFEGETIGAGESETYVVVIPQKATIKSEYYDVEERYAEFEYVDDDDVHSDLIEAEYNGGADEVTIESLVNSEAEPEPDPDPEPEPDPEPDPEQP